MPPLNKAFYSSISDPKKARFVHLSFDAFGTLFRPVPSVPEQYAAVAKQHGIQGFSTEELGKSFKEAYKRQAVEYPVYGKQRNMSAKTWWGEVIQGTFRPYLASDQTMPPEIVETLWRRFATKEAYQKYDDVDSFFTRLKDYRRSPQSLIGGGSADEPSQILVSVLSNYDNRLTKILRDLDIAGQGKNFIGGDLVFTSHALGYEKPHLEAYDRVRANVERNFWDRHCKAQDGMKVTGRHHYIGDDYKNDFAASAAAGWIPYHLDRAGKFDDLIPGGQDYVVLDREIVWERLGDGKSVESCPQKVSVLRNLNALLDGALIHNDHPSRFDEISRLKLTNNDEG